MTDLDTVVFDLGGVVVKWEPECAFEQVMPAEQVAAFLTEISFLEWNRAHDAGQSFEVGELEIAGRLPHYREAITAYRRYFDKTITGEVPGTGAVIAELATAGIRLLALTNWSDELFPRAKARFGVLQRFEGIVVSGAEQLAKPDPAIFQLVFDRYRLEPARAVFVDDSPPNVTSAQELGMTGLAFTGADRLRAQLVDLGLLATRTPVAGPIFHLALREHWQRAEQTGTYPWSTRNLTYEQQGFVHCSARHQLPEVINRSYADLSTEDVLIIELDPARLGAPVIAEALGTDEEFPHLYGQLRPSDAVTVATR